MREKIKEILFILFILSKSKMCSASNHGSFLLAVTAFVFIACLASTPAATKTWINVMPGDWHNAENWKDGVPASTDNVVIACAGASVSLTNSASIHSLTISNATLLFRNWNTVLIVASNIVIQNEGVITIPYAFTDNMMSNRVHLICSNLIIDVGGRIDADAAGYVGGWPAHINGYGPGAGEGQAGGSYGGRGGHQGAPPYGSATAPLSPGSGGAGGYGYGGSGGGVICIEAVDQVVVNGLITANGDSGWTQGGGSGGGIFISCNRFGGIKGSIQAKGGHAGKFFGAGGGGRIAVWRVFHLYQGSTSVSNGAGGAGNGGPGTMMWGVLPDCRLSSNRASISLVYGGSTGLCFQVWNAAPDTNDVYWTLIPDHKWISSETLNGMIRGDTTNTLKLTTRAIGTSVGTCAGRVTIAFTNSMMKDLKPLEKTFDVTMHVMELMRRPLRLTNSVMQGHNAANQTFQVWNRGSGHLSYSIAVPQSKINWVKVSPDSGICRGQTGPPDKNTNTITVSYHTADLAIGTYSGPIMISADQEGTPRMIDVTLKVNPRPDLRVTPGFLESIVIQGQTPKNRVLHLYNASDQYSIGYEISISTNNNWLKLSADGSQHIKRGTLAPCQTNTVKVYYDMKKWPMVMTGTIDIIATNPVTGDMAIGSPQAVDVSVRVRPKPKLKLSSLVLNNTVEQVHNASQQSFEVWNGNSYFLMKYRIASNVPWLVPSPSSGGSTGDHDTIVVRYKTAGLVPGSHRGEITVTATDGVYGVAATGSPQKVNVIVTVKPVPTHSGQKLPKTSSGVRKEMKN